MDDAELAEIYAEFPRFAGLLDIRTKSKSIQPFNYEAWFEEQQTFERERTGRDVVIKPRQIGFSTLELARDLHFALTNPGTNTLVVVHDRDIAEQLFFNLKIMAEALGALGLLPNPRNDTLRSYVFDSLASTVRVTESGATAKAAQKKGRSGTIHRLHATEVAFWGHDADTMNALMAAVPDTGEVVVESTANGAGGMFYDLVMQARQGEGEFRLHFFPWYAHKRYVRPCPPGFDPAPRDKWEERLRARGCTDQQIAWWRAKVAQPGVGLDKALQEFPVDVETAFRMSGRRYIPPENIDELVELTRDPVMKFPVVHEGRHLGVLQVWEPYIEGHDYIVGADVAEGLATPEGKSADGSAATVIRRRGVRPVASFHSGTLSPGDFGLALAQIGFFYATALVAPERNNHGHATLRALSSEAKYERIYRHEDNKLGWPTTPATRPVLFEDLRTAIISGAASHPDAAAVSEAKTLVIDTDGKPRARNKGKSGGSHDDRFVGWAIAHQVATRPGFIPSSFHMPGV